MSNEIKILIVEDEISLQETLAYNLENQGFIVEIVSDGEKAVCYWRSWFIARLFFLLDKAGRSTNLR